MGTIVRDSIVPYTTARKAAGPTSTSWVLRPSRPGRRRCPGHGRVLRHGPPEMPYVDSSVASVKTFVENYKKKFNVDPNIGSVYGYVAADLTYQGLKNAGKDLTLGQLRQGHGSDPRATFPDIFNGPEVNFRPQHPARVRILVPRRGQRAANGFA